MLSCAPAEYPVSVPNVSSLNSGVPQGSPEKPLNFKPVSRPSKVMKIGPKATQKPQKSTLKSSEFQLLWKIDNCNPSHTKCLFLKPQTPRFRPQNHLKNWPGNKHEKRHLFWSKVPEKLSKWCPEIHPKSIKIQAWTPRPPFLSPQVPLDRPMVPGCQSGGTRHAKWQVLDTKSDHIHLQNQIYLQKEWPGN